MHFKLSMNAANMLSFFIIMDGKNNFFFIIFFLLFYVFYFFLLLIFVNKIIFEIIRFNFAKFFSIFSNQYGL